MRIARLGCVLMLIACASLLALGAPPSKEAAVGAAPVPEQILSAKRVFVANTGSGCNPFGEVLFSGGPDRAYNQFYDAMKTWGRYQLVPSPEEADLAFEISFSCPAESPKPPVFFGPKGNVHYDPQLRLVIRDVKTHIVLWEITEHAEPALFQGHLNKNFDRAMAALVLDLKNLARPPRAGSK